MKIIKILLFLFLVITISSCNNIVQNKKNDSESITPTTISSEVEIVTAPKKKTLDDEKIKILKKICKEYPEIKMTNLAFSSTIINNEIQVLHYERDSNGFYFEGYIEYSVFIKDEPALLKLDYSYSAGQAFSASGHISYNKITQDIIKIEYNYGTGSGSTDIYINGKSILEKNNDL